jgi:hypothetical protein
MGRAARYATVFLLATRPLALVATTCTSPEPMTIAGVFCGMVIGADSASLRGAELRLLDKTGNVVAAIKADSQGAFQFPSLLRGKYQVDVRTRGWYHLSQVELTTAEARTCTQPVFVRLSPPLFPCSGSITNVRVEAEPFWTRVPESLHKN